MNGTNTCENVYVVASRAEKSAGVELKNTQTRINAAQRDYLSAVIDCALKSEKARRKRDKLVNLTVIGLILLASLIELIITPIAGIGTFAVLMTIYIIVMSSGRYSRKSSYYKRKAFFTKYANSIPDHMALPWKAGDMGETLSSIDSEFEINDAAGPANNHTDDASWYCPDCGQKNTEDAKFCEFCGCRHDKF